jgi:hypothetical protein
MTCIIDTKSTRRLSAKLMAGLAISALLAVATFAAPANAASADQQNLPYGYGGYYPAPPVAYGSPYGYGSYAQPYGYYAQPYGYYGQPHGYYRQPYYAPPVFYGR